jgi:hypothetical protein
MIARQKERLPPRRAKVLWRNFGFLREHTDTDAEVQIHSDWFRDRSCQFCRAIHENTSVVPNRIRMTVTEIEEDLIYSFQLPIVPLGDAQSIAEHSFRRPANLQSPSRSGSRKITRTCLLCGRKEHADSEDSEEEGEAEMEKRGCVHFQSFSLCWQKTLCVTLE